MAEVRGANNCYCAWRGVQEAVEEAVGARSGEDRRGPERSMTAVIARVSWVDQSSVHRSLYGRLLH